MANVHIYTTDVSFGKTSKARIFTQLWEKLLKEYLREFSYQAEMAGLDANISIGDNNVSFLFNGYSSNLKDFIVEIFKRV